MSNIIPNKFLLTGAALSAVASLLHIAIIIGGPDWYRFFGAGEAMAQMAERGERYPALITLFISIVLASWSAYALSACGLIPHLPLLKTALVIISFIYLARGLGYLLASPFITVPNPEFMFWSSIICLVYGACYSLGLKQSWASL